jgi:hypothetical protein
MEQQSESTCNRFYYMIQFWEDVVLNKKVCELYSKFNCLYWQASSTWRIPREQDNGNSTCSKGNYGILAVAGRHESLRFCYQSHCTQFLIPSAATSAPARRSTRAAPNLRRSLLASPGWGVCRINHRIQTSNAWNTSEGGKERGSGPAPGTV